MNHGRNVGGEQIYITELLTLLSLATYGIRTYYAFDSEEKAKAKYREIDNYFRNHKPNDKDGWSYQVTYESDEVKFTLFDATLNDEIQHFKVIYLPLEVQ